MVLTADEISAELRQGEADQWEIWVHVEEDIAKSRKLLKEFLETPDSEKFVKTSMEGKKLKEKQKKETKLFKRIKSILSSILQKR